MGIVGIKGEVRYGTLANALLDVAIELGYETRIEVKFKKEAHLRSGLEIICHNHVPVSSVPPTNTNYIPQTVYITLHPKQRDARKVMDDDHILGQRTPHDQCLISDFFIDGTTNVVCLNYLELLRNHPAVGKQLVL